MSRTDFRDKKCFVTGAASGIGRATALALAREGAQLFLTDISAQALDQLSAQIRAEGGRVELAEAFDIADIAAVRDCAARIHAQHGSLDALFNIAGIAIWGAIETMRIESWRRLIDINLMGPVHVMQAFLPPMIAAGRGGHLVNVSSAAGLLGLPWHAAYSATKFGLRGISEVLRFDLARHRIAVSLVCPGAVNTGLVQTIQIEGLDKHHPAAQGLQKHFVRKAVTPEQAARAILKGVKARRYFIYTSGDIRIAFALQRWVPSVYRLIMRLLNNQMYRVAVQSGFKGSQGES